MATALWIMISVLLASRHVTGMEGKCRPFSMKRQGWILVLRWPPGYCLRAPAAECSGPKRWVVHGLWPATMQPQPHPALQFCCTQQKFRLEDVQSILADLHQHWPAESYTPAIEYWNDQWKQYGSCGHDPIRSLRAKYDPINVAEYFALGLDLYHRIPLEKWLKSNEIIPTKNRTYRQELIEQILDQRLRDEERTGGRPYRFGCYHQQPNNSQLLLYWNEIQFCFNDHLDPIDCGVFPVSATECNHNLPIFWISE